MHCSSCIASVPAFVKASLSVFSSKADVQGWVTNRSLSSTSGKAPQKVPFAGGETGGV